MRNPLLGLRKKKEETKNELGRIETGKKKDSMEVKWLYITVLSTRLGQSRFALPVNFRSGCRKN